MKKYLYTILALLLVTPVFVQAVSTATWSTSDFTGIYPTKINGSSPNVGIGIIAPQTLLHVATSTIGQAEATFQASTEDTTGFNLILQKSRGDVTSPGSLTVGDEVGGQIIFKGYGAASYLTGAVIKGILEDTVSTTRMPTGIQFMTKQTTSLGEKMRLTATGNLGIGTTTPFTMLGVAGTITANNINATSSTATSTFSGNLVVGNSTVFANNNSIAVGLGSGNGGIKATGSGSAAIGQVFSVIGPGTGAITASGNGALATGWAAIVISSPSIIASGNGSVAHGYSYGNGSILASGSGSFAGGYASTSNSVTSSNTGSFAWGGSTLAATNVLSTAFGYGYTNSTANSFMVGYGATPTLTVNGTNVGISTTSPSAKLAVRGETSSRAFVVSGPLNEILTVVTNGSGAVGINNTSPIYSLDVASQSRFTDTVYFADPTFTYFAYAGANILGGGEAGIYDVGDAPIATGDGGGNYLYARGELVAQSNGYREIFGFGTSTPWGVMSIEPTRFQGTRPSFVIGSSTDTKFIVDNGGKVGVGTTSPWGLFSVNKAVGANNDRVITANIANNEIFGVGQYDHPNNPAIYFGAPNGISNPYVRIFAGTTSAGTLSFNSYFTYFNASAGTQFTGGPAQWQETGTPSSAATQKPSNMIEFRAGVWNGSIPGNQIHQIYNAVSTTVNLQTRVAFNLNRANQMGGTAYEALSVMYDGVASGRVGIGSTTPWAKLSVNPIAADGTAPLLAVGSSTATKLLLTNAGYLGIGTTTPRSTLDIGGDVYQDITGLTTSFQSRRFLNMYDSAGGAYMVRFNARKQGYLDIEFPVTAYGSQTLRMCGGADCNTAAGRLDLNFAQIYMSGSLVQFQSNPALGRTGDATSLANQKNSYALQFQPSVWFGKAAGMVGYLYINGLTTQNIGQQYGINFNPVQNTFNTSQLPLNTMFISGNSRIGVNNTNPQSAFDVTPKKIVQDAYFVGSGISDMYVYNRDAYTGTETKNYRVKIDGTGTPDTFTWSNDGGATWSATGVAITGANQILENGVTIKFTATTGHTLNDYWYMSALNPDIFALRDTAGNSVITVNHHGYMGIGTSSPQYMLAVASSTLDTNIFQLYDSDGNCLLNPESASITTTCTSDARTKHDIKNAGPQLPFLLSLPIKDYVTNTSNENKTGVIAQDLLAIAPDMVHTQDTGLYGVEEVSSWKIIKAIQELDAKIIDGAKGTARSAEENWQWIGLAILAGFVVRQQIQINKLKK